MANKIWLEESYHIESTFQEMLLKYYKADAASVNFRGDFENVRETINRWVEDKTRQKISELLAPGTVSSLTTLVITNAIYFKGKWKSPFKEHLTQPMLFHTSRDDSFDVPMMYQKEKFQYCDDESYKSQVLILPYDGCHIKMMFVLPKTIDGLPAVEKQFLDEGIGNKNVLKWNSHYRKEVKTFVPRFKFSQSFSLKETLMHLGMKDLFLDSEANLSGISSKNDLFVSSVVHKAFVEVNEEGTVAAAATAVVMKSRMAARPREEIIFKADHPFLFIIFDDETKTVLFLGRVTKPVV